jgi:hypothetical protein
MQIRDGKNVYPGPGINIPDPKHCFIFFVMVWSHHSGVANHFAPLFGLFRLLLVKKEIFSAR